jgi:GT2 family glycosyltransferase
MNKLASIIVLTYNSEKYIENCLKSIFEQTYNNFEVIIIDNASEDKSIQVIDNSIREAKITARIIKNKKNLGYAEGNNVGIRESGGEYVFIINPDVVLDKNYIQEAINEFENNLQVGSVQGRVYQLNNEVKTNIIDTVGFEFFKSGRIIDKGQGKEDIGQYNTKEEIFGVNGVAAAYRRTTLNNIKYKEEYFDEDFFCYAEDFDLAWRAENKAWKCIYAPQAILWHDRTSSKSISGGWKEFRKTRKSQSLWMRKISWRNMWLAFIKNLSLKSFFHPQFLKRQIKFSSYLFFFEPRVLLAKFEIIKLLPKMIKKRKYARFN